MSIEVKKELIESIHASEKVIYNEVRTSVEYLMWWSVDALCELEQDLYGQAEYHKDNS